MKGTDRKVIFQGVHQLMGSDLGPKWAPGEKKTSKMVFIGLDLPRTSSSKGWSNVWSDRRRRRRRRDDRRWRRSVATIRGGRNGGRRGCAFQQGITADARRPHEQDTGHEAQREATKPPRPRRPPRSRGKKPSSRRQGRGQEAGGQAAPRSAVKSARCRQDKSPRRRRTAKRAGHAAAHAKRGRNDRSRRGQEPLRPSHAPAAKAAAEAGRRAGRRAPRAAAPPRAFRRRRRRASRSRAAPNTPRCRPRCRRPTSRFADRFAPPRPPTRQMNNVELDTPRDSAQGRSEAGQRLEVQGRPRPDRSRVLAMPESEYMNEKQLEFFRVKLQTLKDDLLSNAGETTEHLREDTSIVPDPGRPRDHRGGARARAAHPRPRAQAAEEDLAVAGAPRFRRLRFL